MITALCVLLGIAACTKSSTENTYNGQEVKIDSYVTKYMESHPESRVAYNGSVVRIVVSEGEGEELEKEGTASILYAGYNFNSTSMSAGDTVIGNPIHMGEDCIIIFSGRHGFGRQVGTIPAHAALAYRIQILDIMN